MPLQGITTKAPVYVPYPNPTVNSWLGHFVDKEVGGEVDLAVTRKSGDTMTFTLNDKGRASEERHNAMALPLSPISFTQDIDLSNSKSSVIETFVVKNVAELQQGVVLSLLKAEDGEYMGPGIKIQYARPSRLPGKTVTLELSPFVTIPR